MLVADFVIPDANLLIWLDKTNQIDVLMEHYTGSNIVISKKVLNESDIDDKEMLVTHENVSIQDPAPSINSSNLKSRPSQADLQVLSLGKEREDSVILSDDPDLWKNSNAADTKCLKILEFLKKLRKYTIDSEDFHYKAGVAHEDLRLPENKVKEIRDWEKNQLDE